MRKQRDADEPNDDSQLLNLTLDELLNADSGELERAYIQLDDPQFCPVCSSALDELRARIGEPQALDHDRLCWHMPAGWERVYWWVLCDTHSVIVHGMADPTYAANLRSSLVKLKEDQQNTLTRIRNGERYLKSLVLSAADRARGMELLGQLRQQRTDIGLEVSTIQQALTLATTPLETYAARKQKQRDI